VPKSKKEKDSESSLIMVAVEELHELPGPNPNVLTIEQEQELERSMRRFGFRQAITVVAREDAPGYWVSDGVHRVAVAKRLGIKQVPAVLRLDGTDSTVRAERLALNRIRGSVDLGAASAELRALLDGGWSEGELGACGFSTEELGVLLKATEQEANVLEDGLEAGPLSEGPEADRARRYSLTLTFDHKEERDGLRSLLLSRGASVEDGLRQLVKIAEA
jgi:ParB-like chromosome segregation protein Spo0J